MADKMIAYCGLLCTECPAFLATQANDTAKAQETADQWSKAFNVQVSVEDIWCDGCLAEGRKCAHCGDCEIRACAKEKGVVNCAHCDTYPCAPLSGLFKMAPPAQEILEDIRKRM